jgi:hypothetical protein
MVVDIAVEYNSGGGYGVVDMEDMVVDTAVEAVVCTEMEMKVYTFVNL